MFKIYLSGGMKNLSIEEQSVNRDYITEELNNITASKYRLDIFDPLDYFTYHNPTHKTEKQILNFELNALRNSNLIIVDFNDPNSLGTMAELSIAYEHRIPVIGLMQYNYGGLHAWQVEMCDVIFDDIDELIEYVRDYYLL